MILRHNWSVLLSIAILLMVTVVGQAGTVTGVSGAANNGGSPNTLFVIDTDTGAATALGTTSVTPNALAFDIDKRLYYYGNHNSDDFYVFDLAAGTDTKIADAVDEGAPANTRFSGPGDYYDGRYYYVPEGNDGVPFEGSNEVYYFDFAPDGKSVTGSGSITVTMPTGASGFGDYGDIAFDPTTGIMYGMVASSSSLTDEVVGIISIDLFDTATLTVLNPSIGTDGNGLQMAFNLDGELYGNSFDGVAELLPIDTSDGSIGTPIALSGTTADFYDMSRAVPIPEPTAVVLAWIGLVGCCLARRRSA